MCTYRRMTKKRSVVWKLLIYIALHLRYQSVIITGGIKIRVSNRAGYVMITYTQWNAATLAIYKLSQYETHYGFLASSEIDGKIKWRNLLSVCSHIKYPSILLWLYRNCETNKKNRKDTKSTSYNGINTQSDRLWEEITYNPCHLVWLYFHDIFLSSKKRVCQLLPKSVSRVRCAIFVVQYRNNEDVWLITHRHTHFPWFYK